MANFKILLPYNFSGQDRKATDFVARVFAGRRDVQVTLFNLTVPPPEVDVRGSPVMGRMKETVGYLSQRIREQEVELEAARSSLLEKGFQEEQVRTAMENRRGEVGAHIADLVSRAGYDLVVLSRSAGRITRYFSSNVHQKVLVAVTNTAVCVVS